MEATGVYWKPVWHILVSVVPPTHCFRSGIHDVLAS
jgi:hypothetical protein